jgi:hypothetical protein
MIVKQLRIVLGFKRLSPANLVARVNAVIKGMTGNSRYPSPPIDMPTLTAAVNSFWASVSMALDGGKTAIAQRAAQGEIVKQMLRQLARYVEANCGGDLDVLLSSGFQSASTTRTTVAPLSESIRRIDSGENSGQQLVTLAALPGALSYEIRWATAVPGGTPGPWTNQPVGTLRPGAVVAGLTPGTTYVFQARAVKKSGYTDWSDSVTRICM